jgi:excinuclease ABC subunit A
MQAADRIIDIGPGPGEHGGAIQFNGSYEALRRSQTLTADYLSGRRQVHEERRTPLCHSTARRHRQQP